MTFQEAIDYVASLEPRGWRLGLDRMQEFARRADLDGWLGRSAPPHLYSGKTDGTNHDLIEEADSPKFIHIAGTNGKGSTTAFIQSILHESGYRTGAFFSPYVYDPRERIQLGRELIPEGIFAGLTAMLKPVAEEFTETDYGGISEFEFKAAMAFLFYKRLKCEWVALEVGLGGRLDATNIVYPQCSVIVSVGLDHTNILGTTLEEIAFEKAGIIKSGVPVIVGKMPAPAREVVEQKARDMKCEIWRFGEEIEMGHSATDLSLVVTTPHGRHAGLKPGIAGAMQDHNLALAVAACDAAGATRTLSGLQRGAENAEIPGRFEFRKVLGKTVILDGAHNADAAQVLVESLRTQASFRRLLMVTGMVAGHDPAEFYRWFGGIVDEAFAVPINFHRTLTPNDIEKALKPYVKGVTLCSSVEDGLQAAISKSEPEDAVLITGSFYLVGEAGRAIPRL